MNTSVRGSTSLNFPPRAFHGIARSSDGDYVVVITGGEHAGVAVPSTWEYHVRANVWTCVYFPLLAHRNDDHTRVLPHHFGAAYHGAHCSVSNLGDAVTGGRVCIVGGLQSSPNALTVSLPRLGYRSKVVPSPILVSSR